MVEQRRSRIILSKLDVTTRSSAVPGISTARARWLRLKKDLRDSARPVSAWAAVASTSLGVFLTAVGPTAQGYNASGLATGWGVACVASLAGAIGFGIAAHEARKFQGRAVASVLEEMDEIEAEFDDGAVEQ